MSDPELIECKYGHHMCSKDDFTTSGLNKKYFTQCRKCKAEEIRRYVSKHKEEHNKKRREYLRNWRLSKENDEIEVN